MSRIVLAVLAVVLVGSSLEAQDSRWHRQISSQLTRYGDVFSNEGYARTHELKSGSLDDDENEYFTLELDAGRSYALLGVCDEDCTDVDLRLFDENGTEIDSDVELDDYPVVEVRPLRTARFRVKVIMATCSTSPCFYGVGVYAK